MASLPVADRGPTVDLRGRYGGVVFDLDDTLVDHRGAAREALLAWTAGLGLTDDPVTLEARWLELETRHYRRFQAREVDQLGQRRARVREFLPHLDLADDAVADHAFAGYWSAYEQGWRVFPDALDAVRRARASGRAVGVLTNGTAAGQQHKLDATPLGGLDLPLIASSELPAAKPDSRAFVAAASRLGLPAHDCVMVGDSLENDVAGALAAGLGAVLLDRADRYAALATPRVRSLDALLFADGDPKDALS